MARKKLTLSQGALMTWWATEGQGFGSTVITADTTKFTADSTKVTADGRITDWDKPTS